METYDPFICTYKSESFDDEEDAKDNRSWSGDKFTSDNVVERVSKSSCMHNNDLLHDNNHNNILPDKDKVLSDDPFNLYDILNKRNNSGDELKYPPGFTPSGINVEEVNKKVKGATSNDVNEHVNSTSNKLEEFVPKGKHLLNHSICSKRVHTGGLILQLMVELVKVGKTIGYNMEGCLIYLPLVSYAYTWAHKTANKMKAQQSKVRWAIEGDENTKFFHGSLNSKRSLLSICRTLVDGKLIVDPLAIKKCVPKILFYSILLASIIIDSSLTLSHLFFADDAIFVEEVNATATTMGCLIFTTPFVHLGVRVGAIYGEDGDLNSPSSLFKSSPWLDIIREEEVATRWVKVMPIKINEFSWRVRLDKLPTRLNLFLKAAERDLGRCLLCEVVVDLVLQDAFGATILRRELLFDNLVQISFNWCFNRSGSESRPPMLNKENYVPWLSCLLRYAKGRPNGKLIHNSILNGPYVRRMIAEPGDGERDVNVNETFHEQTDDELSERELKQIEADDQAIQTILLDLPEDIYAAVDSCETAQEIWLRVQQMMKGSDIGIHEKKAKLFNEWERFTSNE
nr:RNA-directed DNA polymerase, eukaryota, reverse transcriptase zinc-binding domain protein [Tanacetum cinerariifolium]